jgi:rhodanese-related sulfurtransferase
MQSLGTPELKSMFDREEELTLINTLSPAQFRKAHIPGSVNVPVNDAGFVKKVETLVDSKDETIVVYSVGVKCESSMKAARKLDKAGFENVYRYVGGARAWRGLGGSLTSGT